MRQGVSLTIVAALLGLVVWATVAQGLTARSVEELKLMTEQELLGEAFLGCAEFNFAVQSSGQATVGSLAVRLDRATVSLVYLERVGLVARAKAGGVPPGWVSEMKAAAGKEIEAEPGQACKAVLQRWLPKARQ